jgi:S-layer protein
MNVGASAVNGFANVSVLTIAAVETINITTNDTDTTAATTMFDLNLVAANATTITLTGDAGMTFASGTHTNVVTFNADGVTATGAAGVVTFTATTAQNASITGGAGNDVLTGGAANDTITGGVGNDTLGGAAGNDTISGGAGADTITGGTGVDTMTGGAGVDIFVFSTDGSVSGTSLDVITDYSGDELDFGAAGVLLAAETDGTTATSDVDTSAGGKITFAAADDTFAEMVAAIQADTQLDAVNSVAFFEFGGDTFVYYAGAATGNTDDQIVELSDVTGLTTITLTGGDLFIA